MAKTLIINGTDYTQYFTQTGYSVGYDSVEGLNSGKMLNGSTQEDEIAIHAVITLPCMPLTETQLAAILTEVYKRTYPMITYYDPRTGATRTISTLRSVSQQKYRGAGPTGDEYWTGTVITLTENPI